MPHLYAEKYQELQQQAAQFAQTVLAKQAARIDREGFDRAHFQQVMDGGWIGAPAAVAHGGRGYGVTGRVIIIEEFARACAATSLTYLVGGMGIYPKIATKDQLERHYLPWVRGELLPAFCLTEPQAGSDVKAIAMTAQKDGDSYLLNGTKTLIVNGKSADILHVFAISEPAQTVANGLSLFVVDAHSAGIRTTLQPTMGLRGCELAEIHFQDCRVPAQNLLGSPGQGYAYAMEGIAGGRINAAASSVGIARHALDLAVCYAKQRQQFQRPLSAQQGLSWYLAEMKCRLAAARALLYQTAAMLEAEHAEAPLYAAMAKHQATEAAHFCADKCLLIHGGVGCTTDCAAEQIYRDAHAARIYDGTSEILKHIVAKQLLK